MVTFGGYAERVAGPPRAQAPHPRALPQAARRAPAAGVRSHRAERRSPRSRCAPGTPVSGPRRRRCGRTATALLRTILATAVSDGLIGANPCHIRGAGTTKRAITIRPLTVPELAKLTEAMPEQYQAMILLASWCAMRFGELTELRRRDVDIDMDAGRGVIRVERAVVRTAGGFVVGPPKSDAGRRRRGDPAAPPGGRPGASGRHVGPTTTPCCSPPTTVDTWPSPR